jgi:ABC-type Zn uptake system ZnuABC Zn-binding protein ZnuA
VNEIEAEIKEINKKLDQLEIELAMNMEALESIEVDIMLFKAELDYLAEGW